MNILAKIGSGSFGQVYLLSNGEKNFVLKKSSIFHYDKICSGLVREFICIQSIPRHLNIATYYQTWISDNGYILMPYYGENALTICRQKILSRKQINQVIYDIATGLLHMHENGWLHRDVKLENIFLSKRAVLGDFSLARYGKCENNLPNGQASAEVCTLWCRPPELLQTTDRYVPEYGEEIDVFSLGMVALSLVNGDYLAKRFKTYHDSDIRYLLGCFDLFGVDEEIKDFYKLDSKQESTLHLKDVDLFLEMTHLIPSKRIKLKDVITRLEDRESFNITFPSYKMTPQKIRIPPKLLTNRRIRVIQSQEFWKLANIQLTFSLLCEGLILLRMNDIDPSVLLEYLSLIRRTFLIRRKPIDLSQKQLDGLCLLKTFNLRLEKVIETPFLACCLGCEIVYSEWTDIQDVIKKVIVDHSPTTVDIEGNDIFFDARAGWWPSQHHMKKTFSFM